MKSIKYALLGLLLASSAAFASAAPIMMDPIWVMADLDEHGGSLQTWNFGEGGDYVKSGDSYIYDFWFNTPPPTAWFGFSVAPDSVGSLSFTNAVFSTVADATEMPGKLSLSSDLVTGEYLMDIGVYDLQLTVNYLVDGASFTGLATADFATVPEPMSLGLLGLGLVGMLGARRRKARKAA